MKFEVFGLILAFSASFSLGDFLVELKSVGLQEKPDYLDTGCILTGTEVIYQCINTDPSDPSDLSGGDHHDAELPLLKLRIDCRGASGNFQNLSLYDGSMSCGRLSYRKYGNSSEIKPLIIGELPLVSDHVAIIEKEDILDIECVPFDFEFHNRYMYEGMTREDWVISFYLLKDGHGKVDQLLAFAFEMSFVSGLNPVNSRDFSSCTETLTNASRWKMTVSKSEGFSHWIRYSSPVPSTPSAPKPIFPKMGCCNISGEIFQLDKDILQLTVLGARSYSIFGPQEFKKTSKSNEWFVRLDPDFYNATTTDKNHFGMDFKLEVNPEVLLPDTDYVNVKLQLFRINLGLSSPNPYRSYILTLPVNSTGQDSDSESRVIWMIAFFFFTCLLCGFCYVYREDFQMSTEPKRDRNLLEANSVSIELQRS